LKSKMIKRKADYSLIKRKLYSYVLVIVIAAVVIAVSLRQLVRGVVGRWIVSFLQNYFHLRELDAIRIYQYTIRNNIDILIYVAVAFCFLFLCRMLLSSFMGYFDEVNTGIDSLIQSENTQIELSAEMAFIEQKLNTLKQTLEKREQDAKLAEQRKNDMVMYLAHDIKTPLTSVIGYLSLLNEAPDMPSEQKAKCLDISLEKATWLEKLVDEFFEITRYSFQMDSLSKESIDLYYMLAQMTDEFYPLFAAKGMQTKINVPEDMTLYGDPNKLARVFNNILKNAVAYSPDNSVIDITAAISGDKVAIVFTNEGNIQKDKLVSIFDKFYRLDSARSSETGGAGLGLAIAKEIIVLHGGRIYADSNGKQTSFTVELPAMPEQS
jgi:two-component system, OmpR family, sensor histidine kinase VanS